MKKNFQILKIKKIEKKFEKLGINIIPVIDKNKKVINYISPKFKTEKNLFKYREKI